MNSIKLFLSLFFFGLAGLQTPLRASLSEPLSSSQSAEMVAYTWASYDLKFEIPDYMEVKSNTANLFHASGGDMILNIYAEKSSASGEDLANEHYAELRLSNKELVSDPSEYTNEGLNGLYMIGKGNNGTAVYAFIVAGLNDNARENAFKIDIQILTSSPNYQSIIEDAVNMLNSFGTISGGSTGPSTGSTSSSSGSSGAIQWPDENFKFYIPSGLNVKSNEPGYYRADDGNLFVTIRKERYRGSVSGLSNEVFKDARIQDSEHTADDVYNINGLEGWKLIGSGTKEGESVVYAILAFEDPDNGNKYSAEIVYFMRSTTDSDKYVGMMKEVLQGFGQIR